MTEAEAELSHRIGLRLRAARQARRFSLAELAARTNGHYSKSRISNYEQGLRRISVEGAECLAKALGNVNAAYLLCVNDDEATTSRRTNCCCSISSARLTWCPSGSCSSAPKL